MLGMVEVEQSRYEELINAERDLEIVRRFAAKKYPDADNIRLVLGISEAGEDD